MPDSVSPLAAAFATLSASLPEEAISRLRAADDDALVGEHFGIGLFIRNALGLWEESPLTCWLADRGKYEADDASHAILVAYREHLRGASEDEAKRVAGLDELVEDEEE